MKILFLHGWTSTPGGVKPTFLTDHGHTVINPALDDDDFEAAVRTAQAEYDQNQPDVIVGSSRGGAIAMNIESRDTPLVLLCPAWKNWGTATTVKNNTTILHSQADDVVPFSDSEELVRNSGLPDSTLIEVGNDHRLADTASLELMLRSAIDACIPEWTDNPDILLQQEWSGLCYTAAKRWVGSVQNEDWVLVHGTVMSKRVGRRVEHAWCERDDQVVDLTLRVGMRFVEIDEYFRIFQPEVSKRYSSGDAALLTFKNGHDGPWDESEQLSE
ncbi:Alpha/beta hydrolase family protein [Symmachiella dynata]|uniref:alpha/beta hydrolase n=1 Tax=Symmachiella dynata TaxID=2527995 RepID=UPI0011898D00|nr:alpha/beta hydrolase [Symmachiella dynata]QDT48910.1 Alpha/beta hydrolase family protein [Symmachiella dynata]